MKIHSDKLTRADISDALATTGLTAEGVHLDGLIERGSRKRARGFEVKLSAEPRKGRRRQRNTGQHGAEFMGDQPLWVAATWDEHGRWFAELSSATRTPSSPITTAARTSTDRPMGSMRRPKHENRCRKCGRNFLYRLKRQRCNQCRAWQKVSGLKH